MTDLSPPETVDAFRQRLTERADSLPKRMRQCADYLIAHSDRIAVSTVAELAAGAGVQPSAMMRFCQVMGFAGFSDMQRLFRAAFAPALPDYATRLADLRDRGGNSPAALLAEFVDAGRNSLEQLVNSIDTMAMEAAVDVLSKANCIHIVGLRRAFPVASYLAYIFEKMGRAARLHDGVGRLDHSSALRPGDALIAITFSPYSEETIALADCARDKGLPVVSITDSELSPLACNQGLTLTVTEVDVGAFRALSATLSLAVALAVAVGTREDI